MTRWPRWRIATIDRHLVHAILRPGERWDPATLALATELERVLLASRRRDGYERRRRVAG